MAEMPTAEHDVDVELVAGLLADQHPDLGGLPLRHFAHGWDNESYRLGDDMMATATATRGGRPIVHEQRWLGDLASVVRLPIPVPLRIGQPGRGFPWSWSVVPWLAATVGRRRRRSTSSRRPSTSGPSCPSCIARHRPTPPGTPYAGAARRPHGALRRPLGVLADRVDPNDARACSIDWSPHRRGEHHPWVDGDLHPLNLLVADGQLSAVIDWGDLCAGDPATDLSIAWMALPADARSTFRRAAGTNQPIDDPTWARARGWALALSIAVRRPLTTTPPWPASAGERSTQYSSPTLTSPSPATKAGPRPQNTAPERRCPVATARYRTACRARSPAAATRRSGMPPLGATPAIAGLPGCRWSAMTSPQILRIEGHRHAASSATWTLRHVANAAGFHGPTGLGRVKPSSRRRRRTRRRWSSCCRRRPGTTPTWQRHRRRRPDPGGSGAAGASFNHHRARGSSRSR